MKSLTICKQVPIPLDIVTKRLAFVGTTGSGKSYGAMKTAEEMMLAGIQVVVLDPVGIHWGLRLSADRKAAGFAVTVFGGLYGDVPIAPESGALIADVIIEKKISAVIDVSQFEHDSEKARFSAAFAARFYFRKKAKPSPVHLFLEEGQEFLPQNPQSVETTMQHHFVRMSKIGRNFGIGISIITQRPQEVSKKALNLSQALFAFQTNGAHERKAIEEWMKDKGLDLDIASDLPKLPVGEPHLWSPGWLKVSTQVKILPRRTFHPSEEESVTYEPQQLTKLSPVDIAKLSASIKETVERAKENDPAELKRKVATLERELQQLKAAPVKTAPVDTKAIYAQAEAAVRKELMKPVQRYEKEMETFWRELGMILGQISIATSKCGEIKRPAFPVFGVSDALPKFIPDHAMTRENVQRLATRPELTIPGMGRIPVSQMDAPSGTATRLPESKNATPGACERAILSFLGSNGGRTWTREQIAIMTGYSVTSSGFKNAISKLNTTEQITKIGDRIRLTMAVPSDIQTDQQFTVDNIVRRLGRCEAEVFRVLRSKPDVTFTKEHLAEQTTAGDGGHYSVSSSGFKNALSKLSTLGILQREGTGVRLSDNARELL